MPYTHSFAAVTPPARFDGNAWTGLVIQQSATQSGTYTTVDTQTLVADPTPATANPVDITTHAATLETAWFRFYFTDVYGSQSPVTDAVKSPGSGSSYATVEELVARFPELASYDVGTVQDAIDLASEAFEHAAGVAFVPRTETVTLTASDLGLLTLPRAKVTAVTSISGSTTGTVAVSGQVIAGCLYRGTGWLTSETLTVVVTHGYATLPLRVKRAVMLLAKVWTIRGPVDDRATQIPSAEGGTINLSTPGLFGDTFGIPEVTATLKDYEYRALAI